MEIVLLELARLKLHEEVDPRALRRLIQEIESDGVLWSPIIVDRENMVVLDGTHRVNALRVLRCRYVCVYLVDYSDSEIGVDRWFRAIPESLDTERAEEIAEALGMELIPLESSRLKDVSYPVLRLRDGSSFAFVPKPDAVNSYDALHGFERRLEAMGYTMDYDTETDAEIKLTHDAVSAILQPPVLGKEQVVATAVQGRVLSCKATRHVIPGHPVGVDVPLTLLRDHEINIEEANARLAELIQRKRTENMPPGTVWRGRRYDENTRLFADEAGQGTGTPLRYDAMSTEFRGSLPGEEPPNG
ncbi:MAG TPA: ParB N-terminal domain-containing protein [Patescibacteria group bacterium]|nr:ParB N-terminal domain-containing protein [Patescibacteria group bacterium]